ncbi:hypothetical protein GCM10009555_003710 [Acrocarpospora macrocephala]|uniref:Uncharacterized protein n=1 Tax=Acrocarpospora macrocephala TaxID=150177 RepID=A0A5M3XDU3_9ACTN|nr:hypothetical protein Amac_098360 [Acrocarpospora macrocephala]
MVDQVEDVVIKGDHPLGLQLAETDLQPAAVTGNLVEAVQFQIEQFPDPKPAGALQPQGAGGQLVARSVPQDLGQATVGIDRQVARQSLREFRVDRVDQRGEVGLDMSLPVQGSDRVQVGVDAGEEQAEVLEPG